MAPIRLTRARRRVAVRVALAVVAMAAAGAVWLALTSSGRVATGASSSVSTAGSGRAAAAFSLPSLRSGPEVSLAAVAGRPVVLSFFASWCTGCQAELHTMGRVEALAGRGVRIMGIDVNDSDGPARRLLAADHVTYPVGVDAHGSTISSYDLSGLPTTVFLDSRHRVVGQVLGPLTPTLAATWLARIGHS